MREGRTLLIKSLSDSEIARGVKTEATRMLAWILSHIEEVYDNEIAKVVHTILNTQTKDKSSRNIHTIFCGGSGKSGFAARSFGVRLFHLGFDGRCVGEDTVPPVKKEDVFIVVTGSGKNLVNSLKTAKNSGAMTIVITFKTKSPATKWADLVFFIPEQEKRRGIKDLTYEERRIKGHAIFTLRSAFEIFAQIILESIISQLAVMKGKKEADLEGRHTNI